VIENLQIIDLSLMDHLMFLFLAVLIPTMSLLSSQGMQDFHFDKKTKINLYYSNGFFLWILALIVLTTFNFKARSFEQFGFSMPAWNWIVWVLTLLFIILYLVELISKHIFIKQERKMDWTKNLQFIPSDLQEFKHYMFLAIAAGVCEEILFRGFLIHYIYSFVPGSALGLWIAIIVPAVVFAIGHLYQGKWAVLKILLGSMILSTVYLLSGSFFIVMVLHLGVDIISAIYARFLINQLDPDHTIEIETK